MSDTETPVAADADAQALAAANTGYARRKQQRSAEAPASAPMPEPTPAAPEPAALTETAPAAETVTETAPADDEPPLQAQPPKPSPEVAQLAQHLEDLKAQVRELKASGADAQTVRGMNGQIGEINATLKQLMVLQQKKAPDDDELSDAIKDAEAKAADYPELGGTLLKLAKALQTKLSAQQEPKAPETTPEPPAEVPSIDLEAERQKAIDAKARADLLEIHKDFYEVRFSDEFKKWFAGKSAEYQKKATSSWNPVVVAEPVTAFKAHLEAQKRRQERVDAAVQPQGMAQSPQPTRLSDDEATRIGYERARKRRL